MIENGKFVPKWKYEHELNRGGHYDKVRELQEENRELQKRFEETAMELSDTKLDVPEVKVIVNGHRYNVI